MSKSRDYVVSLSDGEYDVLVQALEFAHRDAGGEKQNGYVDTAVQLVVDDVLTQLGGQRTSG